jgi:hypothetical protein
MPSSKSATSPTASKIAPKAGRAAPGENKPKGEGASSAQRQGQGMTRRQARSLQRAYERRRRAATNWTIFGILVAIVVVSVLVVNHPWTSLLSSKSAKTASSCPAPTATAIGPVPAITPPASPPTVTGTTKTLGDGLQEITVQPGCGQVVQTGQTVIVEYSGWVQSTGKLFDSSFQHQPTDCSGTVANTCGFPLSQGSVIQGWVEGVAGMKVGETRRLIIPPSLAYGAQGSPPAVPPNATLIFDITVVGVQ